MLNLRYATSLSASHLADLSDQREDTVDTITKTQVLRQEQWQHLLLQTHQEPQHVNPVLVKSVPEPQLILRTTGVTQVTLSTNGTTRQYYAKPGDLFLTAPHQEPYEMQWQSVANQPVSTLHIYVSSRLIAQTAIQLTGVDATLVELRDGSCLDDVLLRQLCYSLQQELDQTSVGSDLFTETAAQLVAVQLLRQHCTLHYNVPEHSAKLAPERLRQIKDYVLAHLDQAISLDNLASIACLSPYHFCRVFKRTVGLSPNQYVIEQRLAKAKRLLKTNQSVTQVACAVGYENPSYFARLFRRHVGCLPAQFQQR